MGVDVVRISLSLGLSGAVKSAGSIFGLCGGMNIGVSGAGLFMVQGDSALDGVFDVPVEKLQLLFGCWYG